MAAPLPWLLAEGLTPATAATQAENWCGVMQVRGEGESKGGFSPQQRGDVEQGKQGGGNRERGELSDHERGGTRGREGAGRMGWKRGRAETCLSVCGKGTVRASRLSDTDTSMR